MNPATLPFLHFDPVIYPIWRRKFPALIQPAADLLWRYVLPVEIDDLLPQTAATIAGFLLQHDILDGSLYILAKHIESAQPIIGWAETEWQSPLYDGVPLRIPAQWEAAERVLMSFGVIYPALWQMHARMVEAISHVSIAEITVNSAVWAQAVWVYLQRRGSANLDNVRFLVLPTNDIWIRDYGPIIGVAPDGERVVVDAIYDRLPAYPQNLDHDMARLWANTHEMRVLPMHLRFEGGNLWSDGQGTLIVSEQIFYSNPFYDRAALTQYLHTLFAFEKLIITPRLTLEDTGHVDLTLKLVNANTVLVSAPEATTRAALHATRRLFERETNARGEPYQVIELPTPALYFNWLVFVIRRSYTNALTLNNTVLVPIYGIPTDDIALRLYEAALPGYTILPIDSRIGINGGGAVHCMTREIPAV